MPRRIYRWRGRGEGFSSPVANAYRVESLLVSTVFVALACILVLAASQGGLLLTVGALGAAAFTAVLAFLGTERTAILTLMSAFGTAPMYKGLAPSPESLITPTDLLFVAGFALLIPTVFGNRLRLPLPYLIGLTTVLITGCVGSFVSEHTLEAFLSLALWLMVMGGLPTMFALWRPSPVVIRLLLSTYVFGHLISTADAFKDGAVVQGRYAGLATHFNLFAQAGMLSLAILLYLLAQCRSWRWRALVLAAALVSVYSVQMSGSRAATLVVAALIVAVPLVERSAVVGILWALLGGLVVVALPVLIDISGENSALGRLTGGGGARYSSEERALGREQGISRFLEHPLTGSGLVDLFRIHNNYLEVAVGIGIIGLVGYLMILYTLARPLFGSHPHRRLSYAVWAYIGFGATIPSLYDRGIWAPVSLAILASLGSVDPVQRPRPELHDASPAVVPPAAPDGEANR